MTLLSFSGSVVSMAKDSIFTACTSLNNKPCMTRPTLINLNPDEYNQVLHYYPFILDLDRCNGSCNSLDDTSGRICVPNKVEVVNLSVFYIYNNKNKRIKNINKTYII